LKVLIDENLPRKLVEVLRAEGHEAESVHTLHRQGIDNGALYALACREYDLCFTRDAGFAHNARQGGTPSRLKLLRVVLPQQRQDEFVSAFMACFRATRWTDYEHGADWPHDKAGNSK
jgi:predicted nuclease of predicted toxin-antitoxin system